MTSSTSAFTPIDSPTPARPQSLHASLVGALDGSAFTIPTSFGAVALVFAHVGLDLLPAGILAFIVSMVWVHATTAGSRRPILYSARFFEATTMAALMDQVIVRIPAWGLVATPGVRLAFLCLIGASAGIAVGLLYLLRADRFTRFIPAPVFAGFSNSIALALLLSQSKALWSLLTAAPAVAPIVSVTVTVLIVGLVLRRFRPRWPGTAIGLAVGLALGLSWLAIGHATPSIGTFGWFTTLPVALADFRALAEPGVQAWPAATAIATSGAILGATMFLNTTMSAQVMTHLDGRPRARPVDSLLVALGLTLSGLLGSAPLSGSMNASVAASRTTKLTASLMVFSSLTAGLVYLTGIVGLIPLAAVSGAILCEAWFIIDRPSMRLAADWVRRRPMTANGRDDLILIFAVIATAVLLNMVAAVFVGLLFGLVLFAARNARRPVRHVWSGLQVTSNCARSRDELALLSQHGAAIRIVELEGDLFFGSTESLERSLNEALEGLACIVMDWSRVRHIDTSVALSIAKFERKALDHGIVPIHAGADLQGGDVSAALLHYIPAARLAPDLDRALEQAENHLIQVHGSGAPHDATSMVEAAGLLHGLDESERASLESAMAQKLYRAGDVIMEAGAPGDELMLVLHGSASILVRLPGGKDVRLAGARRGATLGEIAFLDQARRSATVIAEQDTTVAVLTRETFDRLSVDQPRLVQRLLSNVALNLAARLRHTSQLALTRQDKR